MHVFTSASPCRYSIDRTSNPERCFSMDVHTGVIRTAQPLDRETVAVHNISVVASESRESEPTSDSALQVSQQRPVDVFSSGRSCCFYAKLG